MQKTIQNCASKNTIKKAMISIPSSFNTGKILNDTIDINAGYVEVLENPIKGMWNKQHPLIHTWLVLTSASIFLLSAIFFITPQ